MPFIGPADTLAGSPLAGWSGRFFHSQHMTFGYPVRRELPGLHS